MEKSRMNLPKGPDTLCFDKDEFMKEDFDVDHFVSDCRKRVQLEALRDDLELYYKLLKTAMVELINKDYADFVNLSTNLVGMDRALSQLSVPLGQLREEVLSLRSSVSEGIRAVDERMSKQEDIRKKKICVLRLIQVIRSVEKIEKILNSQHSKETSALEASSEKGNTVPGYDFLVNSVWPEIVRGLEEKLPSLFNPGNPDAFHQKYTISMDFVRTFERQCGSQASVKRLRAHPAYHSFNNKWNLPVYFQIRFREIAGSLEAALTDVLEDAPAGSPYCLLASHRTWSSLQRCWSDQMFLPLLVHRLWRLTLQILARYSVFVKELLLRPISNESAKDIKKPLVTGSKDPSVTQGNCEDQGGGPSETKPVVPVSSTQLVYVVADLDRLQEQLPELLETVRPKLEVIGFKNFSSISAALEDSRLSLSACVPALSDRITQDLSESCFSHLKSALEVPRLYRRTNKEVPTTASSYVDSALKPLYQLQNGHKDKLKQAIIQQWLEGALSESTHKYYETVSDVLNSVRKMEESLKRLKQARRTAPATPTGPSGGGMSDDDKIRLQLALDVAYLGEQIEKIGLRTKDIRSFPALTELVAAAKDQATAEQP
ncbi:conserved oligomeric Golgi complex subunit 2 isoform X4 [Kogia breviceps]|uniref:conserved oligomeric Golgi complex subunit 2 isoform X4 n=1 Tax=Kogia breviceps TaxID=27615 RepID=UPI0034D16BDC